MFCFFSKIIKTNDIVQKNIQQLFFLFFKKQDTQLFFVFWKKTICQYQTIDIMAAAQGLYQFKKWIQKNHWI